MSSASTKIIQAAAGASTAPEGAWDVSYAYFNDYSAYTADFSDQVDAFNYGSQATTAYGMWIDDSQNRLFICDVGGDKIIQYSCTNGILSTASTFSNLSVVNEQATPAGVWLKPDGTELYMVGDQDDRIRQYSLSTAWTIGTGSLTSSFNLSSQSQNNSGLAFKPDGTKFYVAGYNGSDDEINEYDLSTAWDISTASFNQRLSVTNKLSAPVGVRFSPDGLIMFVCGFVTDDVFTYNLSTAWDISTATYSSVAVQSFQNDLQDIHFDPRGRFLYIIGGEEDNIRKFLACGFDVTSQDTKPESLFFKDDGTKMYVLGNVNNRVYEYALSTAWDTSTATYTDFLAVGGQDADPNAIFFKPDGTKMFMIGEQTNSVREYTLSTAWDVSTGTHTASFSQSNEVNPNGLHFKDDGTKMYISGQTSDKVWEYPLSTAWTITSAGSPNSFSVTTATDDLRFKDDGTKMYLVDFASDRINEYDLSTAWDVTTASFSQFFDLDDSTDGMADLGTPRGLFFHPDGTGFYVADDARNRVFHFSLGVEE